MPFLWLLLIVFGLPCTHVEAAPAKPNILFIFTDDHATHAMSCYGSKINQTPHMDRIANEGMRFDRCLVTNALCGPSRAVIQTGKYSHINGFRMNGDVFNGSQPTAPKMLKNGGYQTAVIGKWHLESEPQGYDYSEILIGQGTYYNPVMIQNGKRVKHEGYVTEIITDRTLDWLKTQRDPNKPFFMMMQHKAPHREWEPGPQYMSMYEDITIPEPSNLFDDYSYRGRAALEQDMTVAKTLNDKDLKLIAPKNLTPKQLEQWNAFYEPHNKKFRDANLEGEDLVRWKYQRYMKDYLRCVAAVDDSIGTVLKYLDDHGLAENTLVIYSSDQGFFLGDHGWFDKRFMYEECYKMPLLMRWPEHIKPGSSSSEIVSNVDFAETFLDAAGVTIPEDMQGYSLLPVAAGKTPENWRKSHYYHYYEFLNDKKTAHMVRRHCGVSTKRYKLIHFYNIEEWELYDLEKDPHEMHSVYADPAYATVVTDLKAELKRLQTELKVPDDTGSVEKDPACLKPDFKPQPPKAKALKVKP